MKLITVEETPEGSLYAIRKNNLLSPKQLNVCLTQFNTESAVYEFIANFCDYVYIFEPSLDGDLPGMDNARVFTCIKQAVLRLRRYLGEDVRQVSLVRQTRTTVFLHVIKGRPLYERTCHV